MAKPLVALTTSDMMAYEIARTIRVLDEARRKDELQKRADAKAKEEAAWS